MKRFDHYLCGYYGMQNTGDDALLAVTQWGCERYLSAQKMAVSSYNPVRVNGVDYPGCLSEQQRFRGQTRLQNYAMALRSNALVFGGGSVLHSFKDIQQKLHAMSLAGGRQHLALGVGLGPFKNTAAERACARFLERCEFVGVRDAASLDIAQTIAPQSQTRMTFDLAPAMLAMPSGRPTAMERKGVGICLCPHERLHGDYLSETRRLQALARMVDDFRRDSDEPVYLIDFNGHDTLGDAAVHGELFSLLERTEGVFHIPYHHDPFQVLQRLSSLKAVISMRLHAAILGFMGQTPVLSLNYHSKCEGWCQQIGMAEQYAYSLQQFDPLSLSDALIQGMKYGFVEPRLSIFDALKASFSNWSYAYESREHSDLPASIKRIQIGTGKVFGGDTAV